MDAEGQWLTAQEATFSAPEAYKVRLPWSGLVRYADGAVDVHARILRGTVLSIAGTLLMIAAIGAVMVTEGDYVYAAIAGMMADAVDALEIWLFRRGGRQRGERSRGRRFAEPP